MATAFEKGDVAHTGIWIGFWLPPAAAVALAGEDGDPNWERAEDLHMTLLALGDSSQYTPDQIKAIRRSVAGFANTAPPLDGTLSGWGVFGASPGSDGKNVLVNLFDSPDLLDWRDCLIAAVEAVGGRISRSHGFTPHITRAYLPPAYGVPNMGPIEPMPLTFDALYVRVGDTPSAYRLLGKPAAREAGGARTIQQIVEGALGGLKPIAKDPTAGDVHSPAPLGDNGQARKRPKKLPGVDDLGTDNTTAVANRAPGIMFADLTAWAFPDGFPPVTGGPPQFAIMKADGDKRWVFGWANVSIESDKGDGGLLLDHHQDMILPDDLEAAAYQFVLEFRETGEMHRGKAKGRLIESVMLTEEKMKAMGIPIGILPVGWWIGFQIDDPEAWAKVKAGEYAMFSIQGRATRQEVVKS